MAAYTSVQAGDFNDDATWGGGGHPTSSGDTATIGHAITASAGITCGAITINAGGSLDTGTAAATITSITTASTGACTIGSGGCTFAGVLNNAGLGTLTINGACTGVTTFTPKTCNQNASVECTGVNNVAAGSTWAIAGNVTGPTASFGCGGGTITVAAGVTISFNSASDCTFGVQSTSSSVLTISGTAVAHVTITNSGSGRGGLALNANENNVSTADWLDAHYVTSSGKSTANDYTLTDCAFIGKAVTGTAVAVNMKVRMIRCFVGNATNGISCVSSTNVGGLYAENLVIGYGRDGSAKTVTNGIVGVNSALNVWLNNAIVAASTRFSGYGYSSYHVDGIRIDNLGYVSGAMLPGTGSALDLAVAAAGTGYKYSGRGSIERSATNPPAGGSYHARITTASTVGANNPLQFEVRVPVASGDNIAVTAKASRSADSSDCADVVIDPEGAWFTPTTVAWDLTNADTYYDLPTCAATGAGGTGAKGTVRVVFRMKEYTASQYLDIGDITITCGGTAYVVSCQNWANGMPVPDAFPSDAEIAQAVWEYGDRTLT